MDIKAAIDASFRATLAYRKQLAVKWKCFACEGINTREHFWLFFGMLYGLVCLVLSLERSTVVWCIILVHYSLMICLQDAKKIFDDLFTKCRKMCISRDIENAWTSVQTYNESDFIILYMLSISSGKKKTHK